MPAVAEVTFKASGQQAVEGAFRSVGSAAGDTTSKIQQNSSAMKSMGTGMKSSVSGIASAATAFATLSLSVVNTWRAYRDLTDAQIAVDKANLRVAKTTEAIRKSEAAIAVIKKESGKGSLESVAFTNKQRLAEQKLAAARKDGKHTAAELAVMQDNINLAQKAGSGTSQKLTDAENKLALQKEQLGVQTDVAKEAQERFNDTQQNFYLSILPTALSGFASLSMAVSGLKGMFTGGGGLVGMFGPLGLAIAGISLAIIAFQTNFLGLRDKIGGVITWFKERFGAWKDTIQEVFGFIQKGDWAGAFNRIKEAAAAFWADLKKTVPFFGEVASLVDKLSHGNWKGAFLQIAVAAKSAWETLKKAVPFFGGVETFVKQIAAGNWQGAWNTIAEGAKSAFSSVFGEKGVLNFQRMKDSAIAEFNILAHTLTQKGGAIELINQGLAKLGKGDVLGGFSGIAAGMKKGIEEAKTAFFSWVQTNFGIDLKTLETQANAIGVKILDGIKSGLTFVARTWIDPIVTALLDPATWTTAFLALGGAVVTVGTAIWNFIAGGIAGAATDPKGAAIWWTDIGQAIWTGITDWFSKNLPDAKVAMEGIAKSFTAAAASSSVWFQNVGRTIWNSIVDGMKALNPALSTLFDQIKLPMLKIDADTKPAETKIDQWAKNLKPPVIKPEANTTVMQNKLNTQLNKVMRGHYPIPFDANLSKAQQKWQAFVKKVQSTQVNVNFGGSSNIRRGSQAGAYGGPKASGYLGTVKRPTLFMAGEGGRQEDISIKPRGSAGGSGGGMTVNVYVDGVLRPARYDMGARK